MNMDILIVDDRTNWREVLVDILQGYKIKAVSNYSEAKEALTSHQFKLAIIDIRLVDADESNIDGLELLDEIDKAGFDTNVIILTGYFTEEREKKARMSTKLVDFISKDDFNLQRFRQVIEQVIPKRDSFLN